MENENKFSGQGNGSSWLPYEIRTLEQLKEIEWDTTAHYILMNDIEYIVTEEDRGKPNCILLEFNGVFLGNDKTINTSRPLFNDNKGKIDNLKIEANRIYGFSWENGIGAICRRNHGEILNCSVTGKIEGSELVGGITGVNYYDGKIIDCSVDVEIEGTEKLGLFCGIDNGVVINTQAKGNITVKRNTFKEKVSGFISDFNYHFSPYIWAFIYAIMILVGIDGVTGWFEVIPETAADISNWWALMFVIPAINIGLWLYSYLNYNEGLKKWVYLTKITRIILKNSLLTSIFIFIACTRDLRLRPNGSFAETVVVIFIISLIVSFFQWKFDIKKGSLYHQISYLLSKRCIKLIKYENTTLKTKSLILGFGPALIVILFVLTINIFPIKNSLVYYEGPTFISAEEANCSAIVDTLGNKLFIGEEFDDIIEISYQYFLHTFRKDDFSPLTINIINNKGKVIYKLPNNEYTPFSYDAIQFDNDVILYRITNDNSSSSPYSSDTCGFRILFLNDGIIVETTFRIIDSIINDFYLIKLVNYDYNRISDDKEFVINFKEYIERIRDSISQKNASSIKFPNIDKEFLQEYKFLGNSFKYIGNNKILILNEFHNGNYDSLEVYDLKNREKRKYSNKKENLLKLANKIDGYYGANYSGYIRKHQSSRYSWGNNHDWPFIFVSDDYIILNDSVFNVPLGLDNNNYINSTVMDYEFNVILQKEYPIFGYSEGFFSCGVGFIDLNGNTVVPFVYSYVEPFKNGFARVSIKDKWGFVNKEGKTIIQPKYDDLEDFSEGLAFYKKNDKWGIIDTKGNEITKPLFKEVNEGFEYGIARVDGYLIKRDGTKLKQKKNFLWRLLH